MGAIVMKLMPRSILSKVSEIYFRPIVCFSFIFPLLAVAYIYILDSIDDTCYLCGEDSTEFMSVLWDIADYAEISAFTLPLILWMIALVIGWTYFSKIKGSKFNVLLLILLHLIVIGYVYLIIRAVSGI